MKKPITKETKKKLLDGHFSHEVKMLIEGRTYFKPRPSDPRILDVTGKDLEAFLVHIRILYEFFYKSGNDDLAHADHYILAWKVKNPLMNIDYWNVQINKYLSHLTYTRVTGARGKHPYYLYPAGVLYNHFRYLTIEFFDQLPSEYMTSNLENLYVDLVKAPFPY